MIEVAFEYQGNPYFGKWKGTVNANDEMKIECSGPYGIVAWIHMDEVEFKTIIS